MLYMVECAFSDPAREQAWNDYYSSRKLNEVLAVPGFRTSQRFKAIGESTAPYLTIHTVDSLDVLTGGAYRGGGGGSFDQSYQSNITNWRRSFYGGLDRAPAIAENELLAVCDQPDQVKGVAVDFVWLATAGLDASAPRRGIARIDRTQAERLARTHRGVINVYAPMMPQRQEPAGKQPR
ncbi:MAG: sugar ABC transporter [Betaproteobacteria bacterium]|nr:sugar ABC transporter [Betaproteobacteria bacterium]